MTMTGSIIKFLLVRDELKQGELGEKLDLSPGVMNHIVTGRRRNLDSTIFQGLQRVFGTPVGFWETVHADDIKGVVNPLDFYLSQLESSVRVTSVNGAGTFSRGDLQKKFRAFDLAEAGDQSGATKTPVFGISRFQENCLVGASYIFGLGKVGFPDGTYSFPDTDEELVLPTSSRITISTKEELNLPAGYLCRFVSTMELQELFLPLAFEQFLFGEIQRHQPTAILQTGSLPIKLFGNQPILRATFEKLICEA